eukprot:UN06048
MHYTMSKDELFDYGWRIPFLCSPIIAIAGYYIRRTLSDPREFLDTKKEQSENINPLKDAFCTQLWRMIKIFGVNFAWSSCFYILWVWVPYYLHKIA